MKVAVFGASGMLGRHIVQRALQGGHEVAALVRDPGTLAERRGLRLVVGQLEEATAVRAVLADADVAISALGPKFRMGSRAPVTFLQQQLPPLLQAVAAAGVDRFVLTSAFGVGDTNAKASLFARQVYRFATKPLFDDKAIAEAHLPPHPVTTVVYPVNLKESSSAGTASVHPLSEVGKVPGLPTLPFVDAAEAIVQVATAASFSPERLLVTTQHGWRAS